MKLGRLCLIIAALSLIFSVSCYSGVSWTERPIVFTSTREVTGIAIAKDGSIWAATRGGVLRRDTDSSWKKFTVADGLPSNEALGVQATDKAITVLFPRAKATWKDGNWSVEKLDPKSNTLELNKCTVNWSGATYTAALTNIRVKRSNKTTFIPLPKSKGTHVSALAAHGDCLWAAMFGDGIWKFDGKTWSPVELSIPDAAKEITALATSGKQVWLGSRRNGIWEYDGKVWKEHLQADEPYSHNCQALASYGGCLFVSTLEDGLLVKSCSKWIRYYSPVISSNSPRQMVVYKGALYVRHGNGKVDKLKNGRWTKDLCAGLPRKEVSAIAGDEDRLYACQWGGWSEFDGQNWSHHLKMTELQGFPITACLPDGENIWIGTQSHGLAEIDRAKEQLTWHDERLGLQDDWIRTINRINNTIYVGTFVGGLACWNGSSWETASCAKNMEVTSVAADEQGNILIGTRFGIWQRSADGTFERYPTLDDEVQSLLTTDEGLWIGSRTGLYLWPRKQS